MGHMDCQLKEPGHCFSCDAQEIARLKAEVERLQEELYLHVQRLAACGVAALSNTQDSYRLEKGDKVWSASYDAVCRAVDREIDLRKEVERLRKKEQVLYDLHEALGVKWGEDPYQPIRELRSRLERAEKECAGVMSTNRTLFDNCNKERRRAEKAEARVRELEEEVAGFQVMEVVDDNDWANLERMTSALDGAKKCFVCLFKRVTPPPGACKLFDGLYKEGEL